MASSCISHQTTCQRSSKFQNQPLNEWFWHSLFTCRSINQRAVSHRSQCCGIHAVPRCCNRSTRWIFLTRSLSFFAFRPTSQGSNGSALYGRAPPRPQYSSRWQKRTPSCAASVAAWRRTCWACGGDTRPLVAGSSGSFGGETTPTSPSSSTMTSHVRLLLFQLTRTVLGT